MFVFGREVRILQVIESRLTFKTTDRKIGKKTLMNAFKGSSISGDRSL